MISCSLTQFSFSSLIDTVPGFVAISVSSWILNPFSGCNSGVQPSQSLMLIGIFRMGSTQVIALASIPSYSNWGFPAASVTVICWVVARLLILCVMVTETVPGLET